MSFLARIAFCFLFVCLLCILKYIQTHQMPPIASETTSLTIAMNPASRPKDPKTSVFGWHFCNKFS
eukprot:gene9835-6908_t